MKSNIDTYMNKKICVLKLGLAHRLIGLVLVCAPKPGMRIFEKIMVLVILAFLCEIEHPMNSISTVASCVPSRRTLYHLLDSFTTNIMILTASDIKGNGVSLMCDKGESRSSNETKKNTPHVKLLAYFNRQRQKVCVLNFGSNTTGNSSEDATKDIDHALKIWDLITEGRILFHAQCTDASGGGTRSSLRDWLLKLGRVCSNNIQNYYFTTCTFHGLNLTLSVPVKTCLGSWGVGSRTMM